MSDYRCPVCTTDFVGVVTGATLEAFSEKHQSCRGQSFDCPCEWERLCGGTTMLSRASDPCQECAKAYPDGSVAMCQGCVECKPPAPRANPLELLVNAGLEDDRLLWHLDELRRQEILSRLSEGEKRLKDAVWKRLDRLTTPSSRTPT